MNALKGFRRGIRSRLTSSKRFRLIYYRWQRRRWRQVKSFGRGPNAVAEHYIIYWPTYLSLPSISQMLGVCVILCACAEKDRQFQIGLARRMLWQPRQIALSFSGIYSYAWSPSPLSNAHIYTYKHTHTHTHTHLQLYFYTDIHERIGTPPRLKWIADSICWWGGRVRRAGETSCIRAYKRPKKL